MRQQPNYTCMLKNLLKLYCIWTWDNLLCFGFFCFFCIFLLMRQWQNYWDTISRNGDWGANTKLLRLKLYCIWTWTFFISTYFYLYLCNACLAYCWLVHYLSLFISLTQFFVCLFCFFTSLFICFSLFFNFFAFPLLSPLHSKNHHCYYYKLENTELHTVQGQ
jgi:hypothetical protein